MTTPAGNYSQVEIPAWLPALLFVASSAVLAVVASSFNPHVILHLTLFAVGLALTYACSPRGEVPTLIGAYLSAYLIRVAAILIVQQLAPGGLMFLDDGGYDQQAQYLASGWSLSNLVYDDLGTSHTGYPILLGSLYGFLGRSVLSGKFLNAFFGGLTAPVAYFLAVEISGNRKVGRMSAWLTALFLYDVMWAGFLLKDTILLFLFTTTVLFLVRFAKTHRITMLLAGCGLVIVLQFFRFYSIAVIVLAALAGLVLSVTHAGMPPSRNRRLAAGLTGLTIAAGVVWWFFAKYGETVGVLLRYAQALEQFDSTGNTLLRFAPSLAFIQQFLKAIVVYQLGPFPWVFSGVDIGGTVFYPGMYLIYALAPFFLIGCVRLVKALDGPKAFALAVLLLHAMVEIFMYQSGGRQRIMVDVLFVICAAVGWSAGSKKWQFVIAIYGALLIFAAVHIAGRGTY